MNRHFLFCVRCLDNLNYQAKLIIIPPDPPTFFNTRPENYVVDETNWLTTDDGSILTTNDGTDFITSVPNPSDVGGTTNLSVRIPYPGGTLTSAFLDLFDGNPSLGGPSILNAVTGSNVRTNVVPSLTTVNGLAENTSVYVVTNSSLATVNITFAAIYDSASGGALLAYGPIAAGPTIALNYPVQFPALALSINLNS